MDIFKRECKGAQGSLCGRLHTLGENVEASVLDPEHGDESVVKMRYSCQLKIICEGIRSAKGTRSDESSPSALLYRKAKEQTMIIRLFFWATYR